MKAVIFGSAILGGYVAHYGLSFDITALSPGNGFTLAVAISAVIAGMVFGRRPLD